MMRRLLALMLLLMMPVIATGEQSASHKTEYRIPASLGTLFGMLHTQEDRRP